jgi:hypothetical protein
LKPRSRKKGRPRGANFKPQYRLWPRPGQLSAGGSNDLCSDCGASPVAAIKKGHIQEWIEVRTGWRSPTTQGGVIAIVLAAFNRAEAMFDVANPLTDTLTAGGLQSRNLHSKVKNAAFAFFLFDSRFAGKGRSRIGQGGLQRQILHTLAICQVVSWRSTARQHVCRF